MDFAPGSIVGNRFRITGLLGEGGMARVYRAELTSLGKPIAIKVLRPEVAKDVTYVHRFLREARAASALSHPHLVSVVDFGRTESGEPYLALEICKGSPFSDILAVGAPEAARVALIFEQLLDAVGEAHAHGILHLDLKPENLLVEKWRDGSDFVRVIDFGIARIAGEADISDAVAGTPLYIAPELLRNEDPDPRTDLYAIGVMLYEAIAGRPPFSGSVPELIHAHLEEEPPRLPLQGRSRLARGLFAAACRALSKRRDDRFRDADAFRAEIQRLLREFPRASPEAEDGTAARSGERAVSNTPFDWARGTSNGPALPLPAPPERDGRAVAELVELLGAGPEPRRVLLDDGGGGDAAAVIEALAATLRERGIRLVHVRADPSPARRPLYPILRALGELLTGVAPSSGSLAALPQLSGYDISLQEALRSLEGQASLFDVLPGPVRRGAIEDRLVDFFRERPASPLVLAFDDTERYDDASLRFLRRLCGEEIAVALLLVESSRLPGAAGSEGLTRVVKLSAMTDDQAATWIGTLVPGVPRERVAAVLPAERTIHGLLHVAEALRVGDDPSGRSLGELLTRAFDRLPASARDVVMAAAIWGTEGSLAALAAFLPAHREIAAASASLARIGFFGAPEAAQSYRFAHPSIHALVSERIPVGQREALHMRALAAATSMGLPRLVALHHEAHCLEASQALVENRVEAARLAQTGLDIAAGARHLGEAYRVARFLVGEQAGATVSRLLVDVGLELARALLDTGEPTLAEAIAREIEPDVGTDPIAGCTRLAVLGDALRARGRFADAIGAYRGALRHLPGAPAWTARLYADLADVTAAVEGPPGALMVLEEAIEAVSPSRGLDWPDDERAPRGLSCLALAYASTARQCGARAAARYAARAAHRLARREGDARQQALGAIALASCCEPNDGVDDEVDAALSGGLEGALRCGDRKLAADALRAQALWIERVGGDGELATTLRAKAGTLDGCEGRVGSDPSLDRHPT